MKSIVYSLRPALAGCLLLASCQLGLLAQGSGVLTLGQIEPVTAKRGSQFTQKVPLHLKAGYHSNSNFPADDYLIPLKLTWIPGPVTVEQVSYPKSQQEHFAFSPKPVSVFTGTFVVETKFKVSPTAPTGAAKIRGKIRYQACNEKECLPPKSFEVEVPIDIQ